jgi:hypothetical protein
MLGSNTLGSLPHDSETTPPIFFTPFAMIAIKSHGPRTLELKHAYFNRWSPFFLSLWGKFGLH